MTTKTNIFYTGATGYIGGAVLARLLAHPNAANFEITALIRSEAKGKLLQEEFGIKPLVGSLEDVDKIMAASEAANVVFNMADCDDIPSAQAILAGMKIRHEKTGEIPILIHTSGTGMLLEDSRGAARPDAIVYDDMNMEHVKSIPPDAIHRPVDTLIVAADVAGHVRAHMVAPSIVFGMTSHALVAARIANASSSAMAHLARTAIARGRPPVVGEGKSVWPIVHIDDTADIYPRLLDAVYAGPAAVGHGEEGLYFLENGELPWSAVAHAVGLAQAAHGAGRVPEPESLTSAAQLAEVFGSEAFGMLFGSNVRCKASRARALGWAPKYGVGDFDGCMLADFGAVLNEK
ncbi:NAD(P)-binding protein [Epithele typhae]|uniref:NAD(P)-binding protein n=1 Tax=Epithele typhae TaxID=378194 RepID=UPI002008CCB0|nr:NAD(P)-binding protein [Epithele typhae]KAH9939261.1 NAD(P)-binding protein [Epithele typhae]